MNNENLRSKFYGAIFVASFLGMVAGTLLIERVNGVADIFDPDNVRLGLAMLALAGTLVEGGAGYLGVFTQKD